MLSSNWNADKKLFSAYSHDGAAAASIEAPAMYGGSIGYFIVEDPNNAKKIYQEKLISEYNPDTNAWVSPLGYYDDNWVWFGVALYNHLLPNLAATNTIQP